MSVVTDSGDSAADTVTIYEGFTLPQALRRPDFAGHNVTEYLMRTPAAAKLKQASQVTLRRKRSSPRRGAGPTDLSVSGQ